MDIHIGTGIISKAREMQFSCRRNPENTPQMLSPILSCGISRKKSGRKLKTAASRRVGEM